MTPTALLTLLLFQACHWAADFTHLSTPWMLQAKSKGTPLFPIAVHAAVHGGMMGLVALLLYDPRSAFWVLGLEWGSHFLIDVGKGRLQAAFATLADPNNPYHWWAFGLDQWLHQAVIMGMVYHLAAA